MNPIIFDDIFSELNCYEIFQDIQARKDWAFHGSASWKGFLGDIKPFRSWMIELINHNTNWFNDSAPIWLTSVKSRDSHVDMRRFDQYLVKAGLLPYLDARTNWKLGLQNREITMAHINGMTQEQSSVWHTDDVYTVLIMTTAPWEDEWGGQFLYRDPNEPKRDFDGSTGKIDYKPGRVIILDGQWEHMNLGPEVRNILRTTIAIHCGREYEWEVLRNV